MSGLVKLTSEIREVTNPVVELIKWAIFGNVDTELLSKVKLAYVFGLKKTTGLMVTDDDEVYSIGNNEFGLLGIGRDSPANSSVPVKVEALCGNSVSSFSSYCCSNHIGICFALTKSGVVYAWGRNADTDLGLGTRTTRFVPTVIEVLRDKRVVQLSCCSGHVLALTSEGEVFSWGCNRDGRVGNGTEENQTTPFKVGGVLGGVEISQVACGVRHSVALSTSGEVFSWGYNGNGQLGNGTNTETTIPIKIVLPFNERIVKIACGSKHTMALGKSGKLYTWGGNTEGQLGNGSIAHTISYALVHGLSYKSIDKGCATPIEIQGLDPILDIASVHYAYKTQSVCVTDSGVYVWGSVSGNHISGPVITGLTSIHDACRVYTRPQVMHETLVLDSGDVSPSLTRDLEMAFDDKSTADVEFFSQREKKNVFVHKQILQIRSDYFRRMFAEDWKESAESSFKIHSSISFRSFHAFLFFLYTDKVEFPENDFANILDLMKLADFYGETRLREQCELILKRGITIQNCVELYSTASKHEAKAIQDFAYEFILEHRKQIPEEELENVECVLLPIVQQTNIICCKHWPSTNFWTFLRSVSAAQFLSQLSTPVMTYPFPSWNPGACDTEVDSLLPNLACDHVGCQLPNQPP